MFSVFAKMPAGRPPVWKNLLMLESWPGKELFSLWEDRQDLGGDPLLFSLARSEPKETYPKFTQKNLEKSIDCMDTASEGWLHSWSYVEYIDPLYPLVRSRKYLASVNASCSDHIAAPILQGEVSCSFLDGPSSVGVVDSVLAGGVRRELVRLVVSQLPAFASACCMVDAVGGPNGHGHLRDYRRVCSDLLLDSYGWMVVLSPLMLEEYERVGAVTPDVLGYDHEFFSTPMGEYLLCVAAAQPADMSVADVVAWKAALGPVLEVPVWKSERTDPRPAWVLPEDWGSVW